MHAFRCRKAAREGSEACGAASCRDQQIDASTAVGKKTWLVEPKRDIEQLASLVAILVYGWLFLVGFGHHLSTAELSRSMSCYAI